MTYNKHLEDVDPSTLSPEELRERLSWRDQHPAEVTRAERDRAARQRLDAQMRDAHEGFIAAGGDSADWPAVEQEMREELIADQTKAAAEAAHAESFRRMARNF
jgi:hypothetical protein